MKKFSFNLETILRLRVWTEEEARLELGRAVGEKAALEAALVKTAERRAAAAKERFSANNHYRQVNVYEDYLARLDHEQKTLLEQSAQAELKIEAARETWNAAQAERKAAENLKERRFQDWRKTMLIEEEKEIAEIRVRSTD